MALPSAGGVPSRTRGHRQRGLLAALCVLAAAGCASRGTAPAPSAATGGDPLPITAGAAPAAGEYPRAFDAQHYDIRLSLPATGDRITGRTDIRLTAMRGAPDTLTLDFTGLAVDSVLVNGVAAAAAHREGRLLIPLPRDLAAGQTLRVRVDYSGTPDDGLIIRDNVHGQRAVFADNWPNRARFWFPSIDHPADKATASFTIDAPAAWQVVASGLRDEAPAGAPAVDVPGQDGRRQWRWSIAEPVSTYNMVIGAAEFEVRRLGAACRAPRPCIDVSAWWFPPTGATAPASFRRAVTMVEYFSDLVAPFPFGKLAHVQSSTRFGGMENATAIFYDEQALAAGRDIEGTVAHETAHQWFGNAVTAGDWPHLWLSEGFATYFATLFFEHADGVERLRQRMEADRQRVVRSDAVARPVVDTSAADLFTLLNANNYQKGGWVLHMLRGVIGDRAFFDGIRQYFRRHAHGTAVTDDFRRAMESAAGRDLDWFFDQWLLRPGFPRFRVSWRWDEGAGAADVVIEQTQGVSWPTFRVPMSVEVATAAGTVRRVVEVDERRETVRIPLDAPVRAVVLDPDGWVLKDVADDAPAGGSDPVPAGR